MATPKLNVPVEDLTPPTTNVDVLLSHLQVGAVTDSVSIFCTNMKHCEKSTPSGMKVGVKITEELASTAATCMSRNDLFAWQTHVTTACVTPTKGLGATCWTRARHSMSLPVGPMGPQGPQGPHGPHGPATPAEPTSPWTP